MTFPDGRMGFVPKRLESRAALLVRSGDKAELIVVPSERTGHVNDFLGVSSKVRD